MLSLEERRMKWRGLLAAQLASGQTVTAWCRERRIEQNTFYSWRKRLSAEPSARAPQFIPVTLEPDACRACPSLTLTVGLTSIRVDPGFDAPLLAEVLAVLEARSASCSSRC